MNQNPSTVPVTPEEEIREALSDISDDPQVIYPDPEPLPEVPESKMTAEAFLSRGRFLMKQIETKSDQIASLHALATRITVSFRQEMVCHSRNVTSQQDLIARILDKEKELEADIQHLMNVRDEIEQAIACVRNPKYRLILEKYYLCNMTWEDIATDLNNNARWVKRLARRGVEIVQTEMEKETCR